MPLTKADWFFWISVVFLSGIISASLEWNFYVVAALGILAIGLGLSLCREHRLGLLFLPLLFGFFYYHFYNNWQVAKENFPVNQNFLFSGIVSNEPKLAEKSSIINIYLKSPYSGSVQILTSRREDVRYGDILHVYGKIDPKSPPEKPISMFPKIEIADRHKGFWLKEKLLSFKNGFVSQFQKFLPMDSAALLSGLTFGVKSDFTKDFKNQMALSGTTHLVALSGYNISILAIAINGTLGSILRRRTKFYVTSLIIFLFVLMVGAEASVVRAAIMGFLILLAREVGRAHQMRNAIVLSALLMAIADPTVLVFNIGFVLSFLSLIGIVYLSPALKHLFRFKSNDGGFLDWRNNLTNTLGAQLAVAPLLITTFGSFSLTSFVANILILEFVPITMLLGFTLGAISFIIPFAGIFVGWLLGFLLSYEIWIIRLFSSVRIPITDFVLGNFAIVLYYIVLLTLIINFKTQYEKV